MKTSEILTQTPEGLYCPPGDFHIDHPHGVIDLDDPEPFAWIHFWICEPSTDSQLVGTGTKDVDSLADQQFAAAVGG